MIDNIWMYIMRYMNEQAWRERKMQELNQRLGQGTPDNYSLSDIFRQRRDKEFNTMGNIFNGAYYKGLQEGDRLRWMEDDPRLKSPSQML